MTWGSISLAAAWRINEVACPLLLTPRLRQAVLAAHIASSARRPRAPGSRDLPGSLAHSMGGALVLLTTLILAIYKSAGMMQDG